MDLVNQYALVPRPKLALSGAGPSVHGKEAVTTADNARDREA